MDISHIKKTILLCIYFLTFCHTTITSASDSGNEGCEVVEGIYTPDYVLTEDYIRQFNSYDDALEHCKQWKFMTHESQNIPTHCSTEKQINGEDIRIQTTISRKFILEYGSMEEALIECWIISGITDSVTDYKSVDKLSIPKHPSSTAYVTHIHVNYFEQFVADMREWQEQFWRDEERKNQSVDSTQDNIGQDSIEPQDEIVCTAQAFPGIKVNISDKLSKENLACKAEVVATDQEFHSIFNNISCQWGYLEGVHARPGNYNLTINVPGYKTWETNDLVVVRGQCHVNTIELEAELIPLNTI